MVSHVTKAVDFHFSTDERIKLRSENQPGIEYKEVDFAAALRKCAPSPVRTTSLQNHFSGWVFLGHAGRMEVAALCVLMEGTPLLTPVLSLEFLAVEPTGCVCLQAPGPKGVTVPKPFNLSEGNKRKREEAASEYVSLAQQVENFQKRTPLRYHLRSRKEGDGKGLGGLAKTLFLCLSRAGFANGCIFFRCISEKTTEGNADPPSNSTL